MSLDQASAALVGTVIGGAITLASSLLTGWRQSKLEKEKWLRGREDSLTSEKRSALADLAKTLASYAHSIMWCTYKALDAKEFTKEELRNFEMELHKGIADMVSSQLHIAALDKVLYDRVTPMISVAIALGGETFSALRLAVQNVGAVEPKLTSCNQRALSLIKTVPDEFGNISRI